MKKIFAAMIIAVTAFCAADAKVVKGVNIPDSFKAGGTALVLNGTGIRTKFMMDIYIGALYLKAKSVDSAKICGADEPMSVRLHIVSGLITPERMAENTREGFKESAGGNTAPYQAGIDKFIGTFKDGIKAGDYFDIVYLPGKGTQVFKNGVPKSLVEGLAFKKVLYGIWIGGNAIQADLRSGMLGL
ncbi:MAG TPA: chalcone isomerase family protein [Spirochaetota bacterium]|mgnify:FL=1|nr:chalcone isomerase family protein [Spirochaetota bacterium]HQH99253.1 chalcone isomerase family protein [Spirochaetota bacterium]